MSILTRVFDKLLQISWQASFLVLLILIVQWAFGTRLSAAWRFRLWWLLLIRLMLPISPPSPFSLFNVTGNRAEVTVERIIHLPRSTIIQNFRSTEASGELADINNSRNSAVESASSGVASTPAGSVPTRSVFPGKSVLLSVWLLGGLVLGMRLVWKDLRFGRLLRRFPLIEDPAVNRILSNCKNAMSIRTPLRLIETPAVKSPCLFGLFRPQLLFPFNMLDTFTPEELRHVFLHEMAHLKRNDLAVNWLMSVFCIVHWFNPLIWIAARRMSMDRELASDELVLNRTVAENQSYGETMLKLLEGFSDSKTVPQVIGILENRDQMERRITMIAEHQSAKKWPALAVLALVGLTLTALTDAQTKTDKNTEPSKPGIVLREVWSLSGKINGRISPDGRYLCYIESASGNLVVRDLKAGETRRLTDNASWDDPLQFAANPVFSPDSQRVAYMWFHGESGELRMVSLEGSREPRVVNTGTDYTLSPLDWSPDGTKIVATQVSSSDEGLRESKLVLVDLKDGAIRVLKPGRIRYARFSPDGRYIAYHSRASSDDRNPDIFLFDLKNATERHLIQHPAVDRVADWARDGLRLLFQSDRRGDETDLFSIEVTSDESTEEVKLVKPDLGDVSCLGMTKEGSFFYAASSSSVDLFTVDLDLSSGELLSAAVLLPESRFGKNFNPRWSPDGTRLAYYSWRESRVVCVIDWETQTERVYPLTPPAYSVKAALPIKWTLDGMSIGFRANQSDGNQGLFSVDLASGNVSTLAMDGEGGIAAFGQTLAASSGDGRSFQYIRGEEIDDDTKSLMVVKRSINTGAEEILTIPNPPGHRITGFLPITVDSNGERAIVVRKNSEEQNQAVMHDLETKRDFDFLSSEHDLSFRISPDGSSALGLIWKNENEQSVRGFAIEDDGPKRIFEADLPNQMEQVSWTPDSRYMLFLKSVENEDGPVKELWTLAGDTGEMKKTELSMKELSDIAVRPNGNQVVLEVTEKDRTSVWAMENLGL